MSAPFESHSSLPPEFFEHYASGYEAQRLQSGSSQIELVRTQELVMRYVPPLPAVVFDVGGGPGVYACWLAKQGYEVHLVDATPLHVELARQASAAQPGASLASIEVGDARLLRPPDESCDVVLLFGPLYHLTERVDRLTALREAHRVLRSGGLLLAVGISRFTSALDGLRQRLFDDPAFTQMVERDLLDGQHRNPTNHPQYFTTAFFHHPQELQTEVQESVGSCMKGHSLLKGHYGFHTWWSRTSRTRSGATNFWRSHVGSKRNRLCLVPARICWLLHAKRSHHTHTQKTLHLVSCPITLPLSPLCCITSPHPLPGSI